jgi:hypothetical protein
MTFEKDLDKFKESTNSENPYLKYNLLNNPFPGVGEEPTEVLSNQEVVKELFFNKIRGFGENTGNLTIRGVNGAGKTNILYYFDAFLKEAKKRKILPQILYSIYVVAQEEDYSYLHSEIVEKLVNATIGELLEALDKKKLLESLKDEEKHLGYILNNIQNVGLFSLFSEDKLYYFKKWLKGQKLSIHERKVLPAIKDDITNSTLAIKYLSAYINILIKAELCTGIVILIDELEHLFTTLSKAKQSTYASDVRHLADTLSKNSLLVFAITPGNKNLEDYPALVRRMGEDVELQAIEDSNKATEYVADYLSFGREKYALKSGEKLGKEQMYDITPLSVEIINQIFEELSSEAAEVVIPGRFLPRIRAAMIEVVETKE